MVVNELFYYIVELVRVVKRSILIGSLSGPNFPIRTAKNICLDGSNCFPLEITGGKGGGGGEFDNF